MAGADPTLMNRVLKHLTAMGVVHEADADRYQPTRLSKALTIPKYGDAIPFCFDVTGPTLLGLPKYLASHDYKNPIDPVDGPFQFGHRTSLPFFGYLAEHPDSAEAFNNHMMGYAMGRAQWFDPGCFPVNEVLGQGARTGENAVMLVDVGGGTGRDIMALHEQYPQLPGRLVLQDQFAVITTLTLTLPKAIDAMGHDFFAPQPIIGARAYYLHSVLHDWPDDKCRDILNSIVPAMTRGYSKLLINDNVIPDKDAHWMSTGIDIIMMALFSASERSETSWKELLTSVGLKVVRIWTYEVGTESLIEAELA